MKVTGKIYSGNKDCANKKLAFNGVASRFFLKHGPIGEATSIVIDVLGKGVLVPLVVMSSKCPGQTREEKKYSAIKNPISALTELGLELPVFYLTSAGIGKLANKGKLNNICGQINVESCKVQFLQMWDKIKPDGKTAKDTLDKLYTEFVKKRPKKEIVRSIDNMLKKSADKLTQDAFNTYKAADKKLFYAKSLFGYIAALAIVPLACKLESWLHPKVMKWVEGRKNGGKNGS